MKLAYLPLLAVNNCSSPLRFSTWDVARFSESVKIHSPAARVFYAFRKSCNIPRAWITLSCTENHSVILYSYINSYMLDTVKTPHHIQMQLSFIYFTAILCLCFAGFKASFILVFDLLAKLFKYGEVRTAFNTIFTLFNMYIASF